MLYVISIASVFTLSFVVGCVVDEIKRKRNKT